METASLFIQKVGGVTFRYRDSCDSEWRGKAPRASVGARILIKGKIYQSSRDVASLLKNLIDIADNSNKKICLSKPCFKGERIEVRISKKEE